MFAMVWCDDFNFVYYVILLFICGITYIEKIELNTLS